MNTLLLNPATWDLMIDARNNIAMASDPYSLAQDAASAIKLFLGEYWYNTSIGVPYFQQILGMAPSVPVLKANFVTAALTVPEVKKARCFLNQIGNDRIVQGQVQISVVPGQWIPFNFITTPPQ